MAGGSREAAAEQVLHPRVEIQSQVSHDESARVQDGVLVGETDTLGLIEAKSSQARRLCYHNQVTRTLIAITLRLGRFLRPNFPLDTSTTYIVEIQTEIVDYDSAQTDKT